MNLSQVHTPDFFFNTVAILYSGPPSMRAGFTIADCWIKAGFEEHSDRPDGDRQNMAKWLCHVKEFQERILKVLVVWERLPAAI